MLLHRPVYGDRLIEFRLVGQLRVDDNVRQSDCSLMINGTGASSLLHSSLMVVCILNGEIGMMMVQVVVLHRQW